MDDLETDRTKELLLVGAGTEKYTRTGEHTHEFSKVISKLVKARSSIGSHRWCWINNKKRNCRKTTAQNTSDQGTVLHS